MSIATVGYKPHEMVTSESTRAARLKWVIIVDRQLPPGLAVNAAACVAASVGASVAGLIGPAGVDADASPHPGLPWAGCSVLGATPEELSAVRSAAAAVGGTGAAGGAEANAAAERRSAPVAAGAAEGGTAVSAEANGTHVYITDMPLSAQTNRVYDGYLAELAETPGAALALSALSLIGPRKTIDKLTKRLTLL